MSSNASGSFVSRRALAGGTAALAASAALGARRPVAAQGDPLPSWNDGPAKQAILAFVAAVTEEGGDQFVPSEDRIAVFDNDGTLWVEQPVYTQIFFALDELKRMAPEHPEWATEDPFATILSGDHARMATLSETEIAQALAVAMSGMTVDQYAENVANWYAGAVHPVLKKPYAELIYQPQLELLDYLEANGFSTWIVSGGGVDFMRVFAESLYGIPPARTIGSSTAVEWQMVDGVPVLIKQPKLGSYNDKQGKPINIHLAIGKRPILACGNSDGDHEMLQYTAAGDGASLMMLVHHDDADREFAYDRDSKIGRLDAAWDEALEKGWTVISMKNDWSAIYPG
jgi:phosphoserine phosphatase